MYQACHTPASEFVPIRNLNYHVLRWGQVQPGQVLLVLLHGWMDVAASFQFLVDALPGPPCIIAPDWRGFGQTDSGGADCFWYPDYLADLDALLRHYAGNDPVDLLGHSMGGNVAMQYAGIRPQRVRRLVNLEGFGLPATQPAQAGAQYGRWLDELQARQQGQRAPRHYASLQAVAARLIKNNPRLSLDKAHWLAAHWAREQAPGQWAIRGEAGHRVASAQLYRVDESLAVFAQIAAPCLMVEAAEDSIAAWWAGKFSRAEHLQRLQSVPQLTRVTLPDCGHMLHHDQPQALAALLQRFLWQA